MATDSITGERVRELLNYDPETGHFVWRPRVASTAKTARACAVFNARYAGHRAGHKTIYGYLMVRVDNTLVMAHRLAWIYTHGAHPVDDIDHVNGVRDDNRIDNLRDVSRQVNLQNRKKALPSNKAGVLGVCRSGNSWRANITVSKKQIHLGVFPTVQEAHAAYLAAKRRLHPGCTI